MDNNLIWISPLVAGFAGALIGTYGGSFFLSKFQERRIKKVRKIAIKGLDALKSYAKLNNTYDEASAEFNKSLTVSEKRAVIVSLHKLGIPIQIPSKDIFNINKISFLPNIIDKNEVEEMILQVKKGHCDHLFFLDVDTYFTSNIRINSIRNIGKKFVNEVLAKSKYNKTSNNIEFPKEWFVNFTRGELYAILVFKEQLMTSDYFTTHGDPDNAKMSKLLTEIEFGIWDSYLFWEFKSYQNIISQKKLADAV